MSFLKVEGLTHVFGEGTPYSKTAIKNVSFSLEKGEILGIIGHTGSGKSTLVSHLNGLMKATSGKVFIDEKDIWENPKEIKKIRSKVGLVFQYPEYQLFEETCYKDIAFGPKNMGLDDEEIDRRVREAASFVGLTEQQLEASPFDLSGGQKRRVAIAGVIAMEPEILILDEPIAGLDPAGREEILSNIRDYQKAKNATVMMVTHSMSDAARMADRLLVMNKSFLAMDGTPEDVFSHAWDLQDMGLNIPDVTKVFMRLKEMGLDVPNVYTTEQAVAALTKLRGGVNRA